MKQLDVAKGLIYLSKRERAIKYKELETKIKKRYKKAKIKYKTDSKFWKAAPEPLRKASTTIGNTIWMAEDNNDVSTLGHEYVHLVQFNKLGLKFIIQYLSPQIYSLILFALAILAFGFSLIAPGIVAIILGLFLLAPLPSKHRLRFEAEGYAMNLAIEYWLRGNNTEDLDMFVVDSLCSWLYYKMTWSRINASTLVHNIMEEVEQEKPALTAYIAFKDVYEIFNNEQTTVRRG